MGERERESIPFATPSGESQQYPNNQRKTNQINPWRNIRLMQWIVRHFVCFIPWRIVSTPPPPPRIRMYVVIRMCIYSSRHFHNNNATMSSINWILCFWLGIGERTVCAVAVCTFQYLLLHHIGCACQCSSQFSLSDCIHIKLKQTHTHILHASHKIINKTKNLSPFRPTKRRICIRMRRMPTDRNERKENENTLNSVFIFIIAGETKTDSREICRMNEEDGWRIVKLGEGERVAALIKYLRRIVVDYYIIIIACVG